MINIRLKGKMTAAQWIPGSQDLGVCNMACGGNGAYEFSPHYHNPTEVHVLKPGDWVIHSINGIKFAVDNEYFQKNYEAIDG